MASFSSFSILAKASLAKSSSFFLLFSPAANLLRSSSLSLFSLSSFSFFLVSSSSCSSFFFLKLSSQTSLTCILPSLLASLCRLLFWPVTLSQTQLAWPTCSQAPPPPLFLYLLFLTTLVQGFVKACPLVKGLPFWQGFALWSRVCPFVKACASLFQGLFFNRSLSKKTLEHKHCFKLHNKHLAGYANKQEIIYHFQLGTSMVPQPSPQYAVYLDLPFSPHYDSISSTTSPVD